MKQLSLIFFLIASVCAFPQANGPANQNNFVTTATVVNGQTVSPSVVSNVAQVDGLTNKSLAGASLSAPCVANSVSGCAIFDPTPEVIHYMPGLQSQFYQINFNKGNAGGTFTGIWPLLVPLTSSNDQLIGAGRMQSGVNRDGSSGTGFVACAGQAICNSAYFVSEPPNPPLPVLNVVNNTGGSLTQASYVLTYIYLTNDYTGADAQNTTSQANWASATVVYAGQPINDQTTNCAGSPCTQVATSQFTTGGSAPSWNATKFAATTDNTGSWINIGNYSTTAQTWGSPGFSMGCNNAPCLGTSVTNELPVVLAGGNCASNATCQIVLNAPGAVGAYPTCPATTAITANSYYQGFTNGSSHLFRAINSGTTTTCAFPAFPGNGKQSLETSAGTIYWQDVGIPGNTTAFPSTGGNPYLPVAGYLVFATTGAGGTEVLQTSAGQCSATVQIGDIVACALSATFTLNTLVAPSNATRPLPLAATDNPLSYAGVQNNNRSIGSGSTFETRFQNLSLDTNNIAGFANWNQYAQELGVMDTTSGIGGFEAIFGCCYGVGAQNSWYINTTLSNPNVGACSAGNPITISCWTNRRGGMFIDGRVGAEPKMIIEQTVTTYSQVGGGNAPYCYDIEGNGNIQLVGVHGEQCNDGIFAEGNPAIANDNISLWVQGFTGHSTLTNAVHIGTGINEVSLVGIQKNQATNILQNDTTSETLTGTGTAAGSYHMGPVDGNGNRTKFSDIPGAGWTLATGGLNVPANGGISSFGGNWVQKTVNSAGITAATVMFSLGPLPVNSNHDFVCEGMYAQATPTAGVNFQIQALNNAATRIDAWADLYSNATGTIGGGGAIQNLTTTTATSFPTPVTLSAAGPFKWRIQGSIQVGASAPTLQIYVLAVTNPVVLQAGSGCYLY